MKRFLYLFLGLVILLGLMIPSTSLATPVTQTIYLNNTTPSTIDSTEWHFVINQFNSQTDAPATIRVYWSGGPPDFYLDVPPSNVNAHQAGYTVLVSDLPAAGMMPIPGNDPLHSTQAQIYTGWSGNFVISHGPGPTPPVPELPAGVLLGLGLAGIAAFFLLKKPRKPVSIS